MIARSMRTLAVLTTLGLIASISALPVTAQTETPSCALTADGAQTEEVTDGVALTFDSDFACTDAADAGTWSITVNVTNDSGTDVTIDSLSFSHASPSFGDDGANTAEATGLPLAVGAGTSASFDASGSYDLVETDDGDSLVTLHLRAAGATADDASAPFVLGINVHVLGPGTELGDDDNDGGDGDGRPSWAPGPPPWVMEMLRAIFIDGFPWGSDTFPPGSDASEETSDVDAGPPAGLELPPPVGSGDDDDVSEVEPDDGPPDWVSPGGPPEWIPAPPIGGRP